MDVYYSQAGDWWAWSCPLVIGSLRSQDGRFDLFHMYPQDT